MDPISLLIGGGLLVAGWIFGFGTSRAIDRHKQPVRQAPVCSCTHAKSSHENGNGKCKNTIRRDKYQNGYRLGYEYVPCTCQGYDGPELLREIVV